MRNALLAAALALCCTSTLTACIGNKVDETALFKPAEVTLPALAGDFDRGIVAGLESSELTAESAAALRAEMVNLSAALAARDREAVRAVPWSTLAAWVERGIADRVAAETLGIGSAVSLRGQLEDFATLINRMRVP